MTKGQAEYAERKAFEEFDKWNDVTGLIAPHTGYYYEMLATIKDAVHIGIQMASAGKVLYDDQGKVQHSE